MPKPPSGNMGSLFTLDTMSGVPFYRQIIDQIRFNIAQGRLRSGDQLPTVRALSVELQINMNTVSKAYTELEIQGILVTQQGTGTFISDREVTLTADDRAKKIGALCKDLIGVAAAYGICVDELIEELKHQRGGTT